MKAEQTAIPFNIYTFLDLRFWTFEMGCYCLTLHESNYTQSEFDYLEKQIKKHETEQKISSFNLMQEFASKIRGQTSRFPEAGAFLEFMRIYTIAASYFDIEKKIVPYNFISWAISRSSIRVHKSLVTWQEGRYSKMLAWAKTRLPDVLEWKRRADELETVLDAKDAELEQANAELAALREENALLKEAALAIEDLPYTLWRKVLAMLREGKKDKEIAEKLYDKGQGLSKSQLGALLYKGGFFMPETVKSAPTLPEVGYLRLADVLKFIPIAKTAWYAGVKEGRFPAPVKLTRRASGYRVGDIRALLARIDAGEGV